MNRRTLLGRFAASKLLSKTTDRPDYFQPRLEPLESARIAFDGDLERE